MFGSDVRWNGMEGNLLNSEAVMMNKESKAFMESKSFVAAERVKVKEIEMESKGPMGEERITTKDYYMKQVGPSEKTYVKKDGLNKKEELKDVSNSSRWSSTRTISYTLTKPAGQPNSQTASFKTLKTSENTKQAAGFINELIKVLKPLLKK